MLLLVGVALLVLLVGYFFSKKTGPKGESKKAEVTKAAPAATAVPAAKKKPADKPNKANKRPETPVDPLRISLFKGHTDDVLDVAFVGAGDSEFVASCSADRTVRLWSAAGRATLTHVELDNATSLSFITHNGTVVAAAGLGMARTVRLFALAPNGALTAKKDMPEKAPCLEALVGCGLSAPTKSVVVCYLDRLCVCPPRAPPRVIETKMIPHSFAAVSQCGKFAACAGFVSEVHIWELIPTADGELADVRRAMTIKGHRTGVVHFAFTPDSSRIASLAKDGTWMVHRIDVRYHQDEECVVVGSGRAAAGATRIAITRDAAAVAVGGRDIEIFDACRTASKPLHTILSPHSTEVRGLAFDWAGARLASIGDHTVALWHNAPGMRVQRELLQREVVAATGLKKERLEKSIAALTIAIDSHPSK